MTTEILTRRDLLRGNLWRVDQATQVQPTVVTPKALRDFLSGAHKSSP